MEISEETPSVTKRSFFADASIILFLLAVAVPLIASYHLSSDTNFPILPLTYLVFSLAGLVVSIISLCKNERRRLRGWIGFLANLLALLAGFIT